ncbi:MAG: hypothetical protein ACI9HK_005692, partial [Pirellulaceae bacterium]
MAVTSKMRNGEALRIADWSEIRQFLRGNVDWPRLH